MKRMIALSGLLLTLTFTPNAGSAAARATMLKTPSATTATSTTDCEGNACSQVSLTWDETKQQYKAQNNATDRWVKIEVSNWAGGASISIRPGGTEFLPLKSYTAPYHANYE